MINFINKLESRKSNDPESDHFKHVFKKNVTYMEETMPKSIGKT